MCLRIPMTRNMEYEKMKTESIIDEISIWYVKVFETPKKLLCICNLEHVYSNGGNNVTLALVINSNGTWGSFQKLVKYDHNMDV